MRVSMTSQQSGRESLGLTDGSDDNGPCILPKCVMPWKCDLYGECDAVIMGEPSEIPRAKPRVVCQFSCGAASAVATKLILAEYPAYRVEIINAFIVEEHPDNRRFLADCETWFGRKVTVLRNDKFNASTDEVWRRERFMVSRFGAPCSRALKRHVMDEWKRPDDIVVLGYTAEEQDRYDSWIDANNRKCLAPLIERGLTKADCLAIVQRAGIELPMMYRLGYHNANCIGCPKGGAGYWNKIRRDFPERYEAVAKIQDMLGPGSWFLQNSQRDARVSLRDLDPTQGTHADLDFSCSFFCEMATQELTPFPSPTKET